MKENYEKPKTEIEKFNTVNIITTSSGKIGTTTSGWIDKWY